MKKKRKPPEEISLPAGFMHASLGGGAAKLRSGHDAIEAEADRVGKEVANTPHEPSEPALRHMERAFGADFSQVSIRRADPEAINARAFTRGKEVYLGRDVDPEAGRDGREVLGHELAHVVQQGGAESSRYSLSRESLGGIRRMARADDQPTYPEFFGPESIRTMQRIEQISDATDTLESVVVVGSLINIGLGHPADTLASQSYDVEPQVRALHAIPQIGRAQIMQEIQLLLVMERDSLNRDEQQFWQRTLNAL